MTDRNAIHVGDLAQVVLPSPCCGNDAAVGRRIFVVAELAFEEGDCSNCGADVGPVLAAYNADNGKHYQVNRLKRIPPLDELDGITIDEQTKELA